ncbi:hypothetical protein GK047_01490 [Paenibacillus sp. SYP-B3998]|uniref:Uncharacterized protein n=1 Tax=Paenibacillus sp. SYP-B3998 TaxID=2678564 RepID=A0A6G3ZRD4_9BACL|nr:hypothetical protein [Paenibacillus sp. SYP-B3998]NEW04692.1 hypothetical protein [Paenibacillus sp. SYP-B3998]
MQSIILIGDESFNLRAISQFGHSGSRSEYMIVPNRYVIEYENVHVYYDDINNFVNEYDEDELLKIPFIKPVFISMTYTSNELMRDILSQSFFSKNLYVDNDHGCIVPLKDFINI